MLVKIPILLLLILLNGVFAMAELALIGARRTRLQAEAAEGNRGAGTALKLKLDSSRFLSTVSIGITLIGVLVSTIGGDSFVGPLVAEFEAVPPLAAYAHPLAIGIVVLSVTFLSVVLGELVPKRIAVSHPERIAATLAPFMTVVAAIVKPAEILLSAASSLVLRLLPVASAAYRPVTQEEITLMMREGTAVGEFHPGESAIVQMALRLGDRHVDAIMTPRTQVDWLDLKDGWETNRAKILTSHLSRFPVVEGGPETVIGIVQVKDLLAQALADEPLDLKAATKPPLYVPNTVPALEVLETLRRAGEPLALVVDEYGDFEGLVTLHDILQALVGDIAEPGDPDDPAVVRREDGSWLIDGLTPIERVKDTIGVARLPDEESGDFHTLGGFLLTWMKRVPKVADHVEVAGWRFEVVDMDGHRVDRVLVVPTAARNGADASV
jgi:putative hemolysin